MTDYFPADDSLSDQELFEQVILFYRERLKDYAPALTYLQDARPDAPRADRFVRDRLCRSCLEPHTAEATAGSRQATPWPTATIGHLPPNRPRSFQRLHHRTDTNARRPGGRSVRPQDLSSSAQTYRAAYVAAGRTPWRARPAHCKRPTRLSCATA